MVKVNRRIGQCSYLPAQNLQILSGNGKQGPDALTNKTHENFDQICIRWQPSMAEWDSHEQQEI